MAKRNRVCYSCKTKYDYCPSCASDYLKPKWMFCFCCEKCKDVFEILSNYNTSGSDVTKDDVKDVLKKHNITKFDKFDEDIQKQLKEITSVSKKIVKKTDDSNDKN